MPGKKKKFIDKKSAVTFHLVHRSQQDPLQADDAAPQHVLIPELTKRLEEQRKYGVFFDDEYDYMQHLKDVNELYEVAPGVSIRTPEEGASTGSRSRVVLPSTVFASNVETDVGMLNKAAPHSGPLLDWDPDIVATLDDEFDHEAEGGDMEDDFIQLVNADTRDGAEEPTSSHMLEQYLGEQAQRQAVTAGDLHHEDDLDSEDHDLGSDVDDLGSDDDVGSDDLGDDNSLDLDSLNDDLERKTRFTEYSMTSSVMRRNQGLTLLDDRFETLYAQYEDDEIGALDEDEIQGHSGQTGTTELLDQALEEFNTAAARSTLPEPASVEVEESDSEDDVTDLVTMTVPQDEEDRLDCESVLSTYSNIYNHPKKIVEPRRQKKMLTLTAKQQIPADVLNKKSETPEVDERLSVRDVMEVITERPSDETPEEKKNRKKSVKEYRQARRAEKRCNKLAFKSEKKRQSKENLNLQTNLSGVLIT